MRVVLVSLNARAGDAVGRQLVEKVAALIERGMTVHVVVEDEANAHLALKPYLVRWRPGDRQAWQVLKDADLVIVEFTQFHALLESLPLLVDGRRKFIFDYHGLTPPELALPAQRGDILRGQDWLSLAQLADAVITHSQFAAQELREWVDVPEALRFRLGYPIEIPEAEFGKQSLRSQLKLTDERILLFVGRAAPNKRLPVLIQALAELRDAQPAIHAVIVGPSGGPYEPIRLQCRELAADLGVSSRVHWMGAVDEATLHECYQSASAFVMPSRHEGFCLPVIEAMAHELPVIAARSGALPDTIANAGLLFEPDNAQDLARQVRRLFDESAPKSVPQRVAVVTPRFGATTGGAERSLTLMARILHENGRDVTVFTTHVDGEPSALFPVRMFATAPTSDNGWYHTDDELSSSESEAQYWRQTLRSDELVAAVSNDQFDAVIVGPYLIGLTRDIVRACGSKTILVPCLHDEPAAYRLAVQQMFQQVGGVLFHSVAEQKLAEQKLGLSHPNSTVVGTWIDVVERGDARRGKRLAGATQYFVYCGRLIREKGVAELIDQARRFARSRPEAKFVFIGAGDVQIPKEPWAVHLGRICDKDKRDVLAGATALITLSANESLSLVVLEANSLGVPVVAHANCAAVADHVAQGGGGLLIRNEQDVVRCLDRLLDHPNLGQHLGQRGREYVQTHFGSTETFRDRLSSVIDGIHRPLPEQLKERGRQRVSDFCRNRWRNEFEQVIDAALNSPREVRLGVVEITVTEVAIPANELVAVKLLHRGGRPIVPTGPARTELIVRWRTPDGDVWAGEKTIPLSRWLTMGHTQVVGVRMPDNVPAGDLVLEAGLRTMAGTAEPVIDWHGPIAQIRVEKASTHDHMYNQPERRLAHTLARVRQAGELPTGYVDVTTGWGARIKKWIKAKLLHNFRSAYVDVLAQQQTRFNRRVVESLEQVADRPSQDTAQLQSEMAQTRRQFEDLADRVGQLESAAQRRANKVQR